MQPPAAALMRAHFRALPPARLIGGFALALIGVTLLVIEVVLSFLGRRDVQWSSVSVSLLIAYAGLALLNGRKAKEQGQFVVDSAVRIIGTVRSGRRTQVLASVETPGEPERRAEPTPIDVKELPPEERG